MTLTIAPDAHLEQLRQAVAAEPTCGTTRYNYAVALIADNKFEAAEKELLGALESSPTLSEAYVLLGGIALRRNDLDQCLHYNQMAVQARVGFAEGFGNIGFVQLQKGNIDEAIKALEEAISLNPNFLQAYANLGNAYMMKGDIDKSIETNLKVLEKEPAFAVAHNNLAIAYLEKGDSALAVEHCDKAEQMGYEVAPALKKEIEAYR